jgi:hypothetical protein
VKPFHTLRLSTPPRVKVLEALGAVSGGRVRVLSEREAEVDASEGQRTYRVYVDLEKRVADSDDNGTVYRGYVGYPIIAFLMALKKLPYDEEIGRELAPIKWRSINERYKSYRVVESVVKEKLAKAGVSPERVDRVIRDVLEQVERLELSRAST